MTKSLEIDMKERLKSVAEVCDSALCPFPSFLFKGHPADS